MKFLTGCVLALGLLVWSDAAAQAPPAPDSRIVSIARLLPEHGQEDCCADCSCQEPYGEFFFHATWLRPRYDNNLAFTTRTGAAAISRVDTDFAFDREFAPRLGVVLHGLDVGSLRVQYWGFDHAANEVSATQTSAFSQILPPNFLEVDLSTTAVGESFSASIGLDAETWDFEWLRRKNARRWTSELSGGLRYASLEQTYNSRLFNVAGVLDGTVNYRRKVRGLGPTIAWSGDYEVGYGVSLFGAARGSILFGESDSDFSGSEDLTTAPLSVVRQTSDYDLLNIGELQMGLRWRPPPRPWGSPYLQLALEGQVWQGDHGLDGELGDLGLLGLQLGGGFTW